MSDAKMAVQMKSMDVRMGRNHPENLEAQIPERRKNMQGKSLIEWAANPPYASYEVKEEDLSPAARDQASAASGPPPMAILGKKIGVSQIELKIGENEKACQKAFVHKCLTKT